MPAALRLNPMPCGSDDHRQLPVPGQCFAFGGGAIRTLSDMNMTDCVFSGNQSQSDGGAIYSFIHLNSPATQTMRMNIDNCEFSGNASLGLGGAIVC